MSHEIAPVANSYLYKSNPLKLQKYVDKFVEIETVDGEKFHGTVYTIDPVSESVVLVTKSNGITSMSIVMGHAVNSLSITSEAEVYMECEELFVCNNIKVSKEEEKLRKEKLKIWLLKNRIPIEEKGEILFITDALQIHPPYGVEQCSSGNEIILGRVQNLILSMPDTVTM